MEPAEESLKTGSQWIYERTGEVVQICMRPMVKDAGDANWQAGVMFFPVDNSDKSCYVRSLSDFLAKYKLKGVEGNDDSTGNSKDVYRGAGHWHEPGKD